MTITIGPVTETGLGAWSDTVAVFPERATSRTTIDTHNIDEMIVDVLANWGALPSEAVSTSSPVVEPPSDPVEAVAWIVKSLQVSQDEVLRAVGIAERTFFGWKRGGRKPRTESLGALWPMTQVLVSLGSIRQDLASWFHSSPEALERFRSGDANGLAIIESESWHRTSAAVTGFFMGDGVSPSEDPSFRSPLLLTSESFVESPIPRQRVGVEVDSDGDEW